MSVELHALVGRERESLALDGFLSAVEDLPAAFTLEGEAGIGKTSLFEHGRSEASRLDYRVLVARPTEAERPLSFVGLTDLLAETGDAFADLPAPQRHALEVALLEEEADIPPDPRAIGMGLLGALRALAHSRPVLVAIDDLQWLDAPSATALAFAFRRVTDERIGLLATLRSGGGGEPIALADGRRDERLTLAPLTVGATHALLVERFELSIPRSVLLRVHETSRGNPLLALELGRALQERGLPEPGRPFDIPTDAEALFGARLDRLPDDTLDALALAAATAVPSIALLSELSAGHLESAVQAGIIRLKGDRVHFTHPLLASAAYTRLDRSMRTELHRRLASVVANREERARHLALATDGPDPEVAAALDEASSSAALRGAPGTAAELAELALKLTPTDDTEAFRARKSVAAEQHGHAGDIARARTLLEELVGELPPGSERAKALYRLANAQPLQIVQQRLREQAVAEAEGDDEVLAGALRALSLTLFVRGDPLPGLARAREAVATAERTKSVRLLVSCLSYLGWMEIGTVGPTPGSLDRALAFEEEAGYLEIYESPLPVEGMRLMLLEDDLDGARARFSEAEERARNHADDGARSVLLGHLAEVEYRAGRFDEAAAYAAESLALREQFGLNLAASLYFVSLVEGARGNREAAEAAAERGHAISEEAGYEIFVVRNLRALGLAALADADFSRADEILATLPDRLARRGYGPALRVRFLPDAIEAALGAGGLERARQQFDELAEIARTSAIPYARVGEARCRALLAAADRDFDRADVAFADALDAHDRLPDPLEHGRTLLSFGQTQRRAGRRSEARATLQEALAILDELGAKLWARQARDELERLGGRTPSGRDLTQAEDRVARLVAEGMTNREVAAALFVTERTVETHLSSIYRKLELRSRSELARHLTGSGERTS